MATQTTGGGSTTSFSNTPQARDDSYLYEEDWLRNSSFYNIATNTITLDVMSNDLGGGAKTLFSVADGDGNAITSDYELLCKDVNAAGCSPWEATLLGNWVRINNGKIEYRIADGSGVQGQGVDVNTLNALDVIDDQFVYAIRLGNGTLSQATVKVTIFGTNDLASITGAASGGVTEDVTLTASGTLVVSDVDAGENELQPIAAGTAGTNGYGTFEVLANGQWTYSLSNGSAAVQELGVGETLQDSITVWSEDLTASQVISITITGTNDAPVLTVDASGGVTEDVGVVLGSISDTGSLSFTDVDVNDTHSVSSAYNSDAVWSGGVLSAAQIAAITAGFSADADSWDYSVANAALDFLGAGETISLSFDVTVTDDSGALNNSDTETVALTITGTNDAPVLTVDTSGGVTEDVGVVLGSISDTGSLSFTDVDVNDTHLVSASYNSDAVWSGGVLSAAQIAAITAGFSADADSWDYSVANAALDFLGAGETITLSFDVTVTDDSGALNNSDTETVALTITGTNDAPVLTVDASGGVTEDVAVVLGNVGDTGSLSFADLDVNDTHSVSSAYNGDAAWSGGALSAAQVAAISAGFSADADSWDYSAANADLDFLGAGETITLSFDVTVTDDSGAANNSDTETVTLTITGTNDAPVLTGTQATLGAGTEDVAYVVSAASLLAGFTDVDGDTVAVASLSANHGTIIDNGNGTYTVTPSPDYFGPVILSYNVIDGNGGVTPATLSFNLAAVNDPAIVAGTITGTVVEATPANAGTPTATGTLTASDVDNAPNSFIAAGSTVTASGYGSFTMSAGGVWIYTVNNANATVNALATGMFLIDTFTVQTADGTTQTITVTIDGTTDATIAPVPFTGGGDLNDFDSLVGGAVNNGANISGDGGNNTITGGAGDQSINGNNGNDTIYGGGGVDTINGGNDNDTLYGQAGNDDLNGNNGLDSVYGGSGNDALVGGNQDDTLYGGSGSDTISGAGGNDIIIGGYGADTLSGDTGADTFRYLSLLDTNDVITDFLLGTDLIDLSALDANSAMALDQGFGWGGNTPTANSLWFEQSGTDTLLFGDTDGNAATAEFMITLQNVSSFTPYSNPLDPPPPGFTF